MRTPAPPGRILLALESSGPGGAERVVLDLARGLRARGREVVLCTMRPGWLTETAEAERLETWVLPQRPGVDVRWVLALRRRMRAAGIEFVHAHEFAMSVFGGAAARLAGLGCLATLHGHGWLVERADRRLACRLLWRAGMGVSAVSGDLADFLAGRVGIPRSAIHVLPNGTPLPSAAAGSDRARAEVRRQLGIDEEAPLVLAVGNLYPVKAHATLVAAARAVPGVTFAVAGRGPEEERLRALVRRHGLEDRFRLLGLRRDVPRLLTAADLFAHCSRNEGLPMAVLEAMAAGLPVVATRVGGLPEVVRDGETGLLVPPDDAAEIAGAIAGLLSDPERARRLGRAGRERALREFSLDAMVERALAVYDLVASARRTRRPDRSSELSAAPTSRDTGH